MQAGISSKTRFGILILFALTPWLAAGAFTNQIVASGQRHVLVIRADGTVWSLGAFQKGQAGVGFNNSVFLTFLVKAQGIVGAVSVAAGDTHSLVLKGDGTVCAFGENGQGRLGINSVLDQSTPTNINNLTSVQAVAAGAAFSMALLNDGHVKSWGANANGQLGINNTVEIHVPTNVTSLSNITAIACGNQHALALASNGTVWAWGKNATGQLGINNTTEKHAPVQIPTNTLSGVMAIAAGEDFSIALKTNRTVWTWGEDANGRLGIGTTSSNAKVPTNIVSLTNIVQIQAGPQQGYALDGDGQLWVWGNNGSQALGLTNRGILSSPVKATGVFSFMGGGPKTYDAANQIAAALGADGNLYFWGIYQFILNNVTLLWDSITPTLPSIAFELGYKPAPGGSGVDPLSFYRGTATSANYASFVLPLDFQKGVALTNVGGAATDLLPFVTNSPLAYHYNAANPGDFGQTNLALRIPFQNPIVAFGSRVGGSALFAGRSYRLIAYAGSPSTTNAYPSIANYLDALKLEVYSKSDFSLVGVTNLPLPFYLATNGAWTTFVSNGLATSLEAFGLKTTISTRAAPFAYGVTNDGVLELQHTAADSSSNYIYLVKFKGFNGKGWAALAANGSPAWQPLCTLEFSPAPPWNTRFLTEVQFQGLPLPSFYDGKSVTELLTGSWNVTNVIDLMNSIASYTNLDQSPELRAHPILDDFVDGLKGEPLALARFVQNEIELTDALDYTNVNQVAVGRLNLMGINRGALGVFLERQGSPTEQCALLIYLLRRAGIPAVYAFPPNNGIGMFDLRLSKMLRIQLAQAMDPNSYAINTNSLIAVNYPWVAAYIDGKWTHLFPWIKDVEITQGPNLYDFLPDGYGNATQWVMNYLHNRPEITGLGTTNESNTVELLFPRYVEQQLLLRAPGISFDELGVRAVNRKVAFNSLAELPKPTWVAPTNQVADSLSDSMLTNEMFRSWNPNVLPVRIFNTVQVQIDYNGTNRIDTGELRCCDVHGRQLLISHERAGAASNAPIQMNLSLAPYRPGLTGLGQFTNEPALLNRQVQSFVFPTTKQNAFNTRVSINRFRPTGADDTITRELAMSKGDLNALCLSWGRVTKEMLEPVAQAVWQVELRIKQDDAVKNTLKVEDYQGPLAYLMGMSYYEKVDHFRPTLERLHGRSPIAMIALGASKLLVATDPSRADGLRNGPLVYAQPSVDMVYNMRYSIEAPKTRADAGENLNGATDAFSLLGVVDASGKEHDVINTFFKEADAVSTVRLLQLSEQRIPGSVLYVDQTTATEVLRTNFPIYSDPIWRKIFEVVDRSPESWALSMAQTTTNTTRSYTGLGGLIVDRRGSYYALISGANVPNGGWGSTFPIDDPFGFGNLDKVALGMDWQGSLSVSYNPPSATFKPMIEDSLAGFRAWDVFNDVQNSHYTPTAYNTQWTFMTAMYSQINQTVGFMTTWADSLFTSESRGYLGYLTDGIGQALAYVSDPVHAVSGEFYVDTADLSLVGPLPLEIRRNYSSLNLADNEFGIGWKIGFTPYIHVPTNGAVMYAAEPDGSVLAYEPTTTNSSIWRPTLGRNPQLVNNRRDGIGSTANQLLSRIEQKWENGNTNFYLYSPNGDVRLYQQRSFSISNVIDRTRPYLARWSDNRGNTLSFEFGTNQPDTDYGELRRIDSSNGGYLQFRYDVYGHIVEASSDDGRHLHYRYDEFGDLVNVRLADNSEHTYEYEHDLQSVTNGNKVTKEPASKHLLVTERKPDGRRLFNVYDSQRRVITQASTVGLDLNLVTNATFVYSNNFVLTNSFTNTITGYTLITDAFGKTTRYGYGNSEITNVLDPLGLSFSQEWYPDNAGPPGYPRSVKKQTDQRGLVTEYQYDTFGNITNTITTGSLTGGSGGETGSERAFYNTNQLPTMVIDPLGDSNVIRYHATFKFFPEEIVTYKQGQPIVTNRGFYDSITNVVTYGNRSWTNVALGMVRSVVRAYGSADATTNEWFYDGRGFVTNEVGYAGPSQPALTNFYSYNGRGEMFEVRDVAGRRSRFDYDQAGRLKAEEVFEAGATFPLSWQYSYYNQNGELTWSDGPQFDPEDYVWRDYDGAGRKIVEARWRSQAKADGSGVEEVPGDGLYSLSYFNYDPAGNLTNSVDPLGNFTVMAYDAIGRMTQQVAYAPDRTPLATNSFVYEPGGKVARATNALGGVSETLYNQAGRPFSRTNPDGSTNGWRYDLLGRVIQEFQPNGSHWDISYDDAHRLIGRQFISSGGSLLAATTNWFDRRGNAVTNINAEGGVFFTIYDGLDRPMISGGPPTVPGVSTQRVSYTYYDAASIWVTNEDLLGQRVLSKFDALHRPVLTEIRDRFHTNALLWSQATLYSDDHHGVLTALGTTSGTVSGPIYHLELNDSFGNGVLSFPFFPVYNDFFERSTYDVAGRLVESVDELNQATTFTYDGLGRVRTRQFPDGATITHSYNAEGGLTAMAMPGGLTWSAIYNAANQRVSEKLSNGGAVNRQFTNVIAGSGPLAGLVQTTIDLGRSVTNTFVYDPFLRVVTNVATGLLLEQGLVTSFQYDRRGLVTNTIQISSVNPSTSVARVHDGYGEVIDERVSIGGVLQSDYSQVWDAAGRRRQLAQAGGALGGFSLYSYRADGRMSSVRQAGYNYDFGYEDSGLLWSRANPFRTHQVLARFPNGKASWQQTWAGTNYVFGEVMDLWADSKLYSYSAARAGTGAWNDDRFYRYNTRNQLTNEGVGIATGVRATNQFAFDANKLGVLTSAQLTGLTNGFKWQATSLSTLGQVTTEGWNESGLKFRANGSAANALNVSATLDGNPISGLAGTTHWFADLSVAPGPHTLAATAQYAAGQCSATATSAFSVLGTNGVTDYYDLAGNVTARVFTNGVATNRIQALKWDAAGRLVSLNQRDLFGTGFDWSAIYDALGRRLRTVLTPVVSNTVNSAMTEVQDSFFDPEVEFLELAVSLNGQRTWKIMGPDLDGEYGGMQGLGGLEATYGPNNQLIPVLTDLFGNVLATVSSTNATWNPARVSGYGPVLGYQAPRLSEATPLNETLVWRGRRMDPSGLYCLGARYYDPVAGRFLSPDPGGHGASMDLYSFADGDPINQFDPDGRFVAGAWNGAKSWGSSTYASAGNLVDALLRPFFSERYGLLNLPGGHEADPNYAKNYENGSTAYQLGHMAGYVGAEFGFQLGLGAMAKGMGMLARMATLRSVGMAAEFGLETAEMGARGFELAGSAESMAARGEAGALRAEAALMRAEAGMVARSSMARAESAVTRMFEGSLVGPGRLPEPFRMTGAGGSKASLMRTFDGSVPGQGGALYGALQFDSPASAKAVATVQAKRGVGYGFIKGDKVTIIRVPRSQNLGHAGLIKSGRVKFTPDMRAFSVMNLEGKQMMIFPWSEWNPKGNPNLSNSQIKQLKQLLGIPADIKIPRL